MSRFHRLIDWINTLLPPPSEEQLRELVEKDRVPNRDLKQIIEQSDPIERGRREFGEGRFSEALLAFEEAIEQDENNSWAWHGRGDALQLLGEPFGALEAYNKAVGLNSQIGLHHGGRANALQALGRVEEAEAAMAKALALDKTLGWMNRKIHVKNAP